MKRIGFLLCGVGLQLVFAVVAFHVWPECRFIFLENRLLENLTALFFLAVLLDVHLVRFAADGAVEETLEMNAALTLALVGFLPMLWGRGNERSIRRREHAFS